ncbi:hypothetical protein GBAR_LOCUS8699, partial [Geodia barretti]
ISWTLAEDVTATSYTVSYFNTNCSGDTGSITTDSMEHRLTELEEGTTYLITVTTTLRSQIIKYNITAATNGTVPSAPPSSLDVCVVNSSTITVQWGEVPCIHQNGAIT